ncbi:MAG: efflux RND transporter permease subunit [Pseudomonadales bacterium]
MKAIIRFFVERPLVVNLIMFVVFLAGYATIGGMRYEYNPTVDMGSLNITTIRAGSGPEEIELAITLPLEEELLKVDGIDKIYSRSLEGMSLITVRLDVNIGDKRKALNDLQKAVDRAESRLPADLLERPVVEELSTLQTPVAEVHIQGDVSEELLRQVARKVSDGLREVGGVAGVIKTGYRRPEVKIQLSPEIQARLGISLAEITDAIHQRNVRDSGGALASFATEKKVVTVGQFANPREVEQVVLRSVEPGNAVRLRDVATVVMDYEDWDLQSRTNGQLSISLLARKQATADELHTAQNIRDYVERIKPGLPQGVKASVVNDISRLTVNMLEMLISNAVLGFALVFLLLCYFLNIRYAAWVAVGIPFSICLTFMLCAAYGISINSITLTAVILLMGILVDDAIVVSENIQRLREQGLTPAQASIQGASEVAKPVIYSALTTMLAFSPLLAIKGDIAEFMVAFPITVILLLSVSLFESQCLLPSHLAGIKQLPVSSSDSGFRRLQARYQRLINRLLRRRLLTLFLFVSAFVGILIFGAMTIKFHMFPEVDIDTINVKVEMPIGTSFEQTANAVKRLELELQKELPMEEVVDVVSQIGHHDTDIYGFTEGFNKSWAVISIYLKPVNQRQTDTYELVDKLRTWIAPMSGFRSLAVDPLVDIPVNGKPIELDIIGSGNERYTVAEDFLVWLRQHPHVTNAWTSYNPGKDIVDLEINHALLAARGLTVRDVTLAVRVAMDGLLVDELQTLDERVRFRLQYPQGVSGQLEALKGLFVVNSRGQAIALKGVVDFVVRPGEADIKHYFGQRTVTVFADINRGAVDIEEINKQASEYVAEQGFESRYPELRLWFGGELEQQRESTGAMGQGFLMAVVAIFAILVLLFNSISQPMIIMLCIPFGMTGVIIGFGLQGEALGMMALTGIIGLIGVLVNDSLVLMHRLNVVRNDKGEHLNVDEIATICGQRFRPIMITSLTTTVGLFPTAYGILGENSYVTPMVMAMAWGVMFGGVVSLILLPVLYALDQDIRAGWARLFGRAETQKPSV